MAKILAEDCNFGIRSTSARTANNEMDEVVFVDRRSLPSHNK
ncbi:hypothetical protein QUA70_06740 [Microcoleus sp. LAD1_D5]